MITLLYWVGVDSLHPIQAFFSRDVETVLHCLKHLQETMYLLQDRFIILIKQ